MRSCAASLSHPYLKAFHNVDGDNDDNVVDTFDDDNGDDNAVDGEMMILDEVYDDDD